jgi:hypothetical protein
VRERRFIAREEDDIPGNIKAMETLSAPIPDEREGWTPLTPEEIAASDSMDGLQDQSPLRVSRFATGQTGSFPAETAPTGENRDTPTHSVFPASSSPDAAWTTDVPGLNPEVQTAEAAETPASAEIPTDLPPLLQWLNAGHSDVGAATNQQATASVEASAISDDLASPAEVDASPVQVAAISDDLASPAEVNASPVQVAAISDDLASPAGVNASPVEVAAISDDLASPAGVNASSVETPASNDAPASSPADDAVSPAEGSHNPTEAIMANGEWRMANGE